MAPPPAPDTMIHVAKNKLPERTVMTEPPLFRQPPLEFPNERNELKAS